jgi:major membrane immunogen (membrane-anchored lipoprotein)
MNELSKSIEETVNNQLLQAQERADKRALCIRKPDKWRKIATCLADPATWTHQKICKEVSTSHHTIHKVIRELAGSLEEFRKYQATRGEIVVDMLDQAKIDKLNRILETEGKFDEKDAKSLKELSAASGIIQQRVNRYHGEADKIIKTEGPAEEDYEDYLDNLRRKRKELIIDAEVVDD